MIAVTLALLLAPAPAVADVGPQPTMEEFAAVAEPALSSKLRRNQSVTYRWPYRLVAGPAGYYTCGLARSIRNRRSKEVWVSAVVANGRAVDFQWSTLNGMLAWQCRKAVKEGTLEAR